MKRKACPELCRGGFGLVDLLMTIGMIMLAAFIFLPPLFVVGRGKTRISSCQSTLAQIYLAARMYQIERLDSDSNLLSALENNSLHPIDDNVFFRCPSAKLRTRGYGLTNIRDFNIPNPERTVFAGDGDDMHLLVYDSFSRMGTITYRHHVFERRGNSHRVANLLFADGHVKLYQAGNPGINKLIFPGIPIPPPVNNPVRKHYKGDVVELPGGAKAVVTQEAPH